MAEKEAFLENRGDNPFGLYIPEKASSKQAVIYKSLSHSIDPAALIRSVNSNRTIEELGIFFHNAWSREAIHCGPHWPVWQQKANYFFSPKAINHLLAETSFKLKDAYPVEYLIHKNTVASKNQVIQGPLLERTCT